MLSMSESYAKATGNPYAIEEVKKFAQQLAKKTADWEDGKK